MKKKLHKKVIKDKLLFFVPRVLVIIYIIFLSLYALDVFSEGYGFFETILALFIHLIPSIVLALLLWYAWNHEKIGGFAFLVIGLVFTIYFDLYKNFAAFLMIGVPVFIAGILFLLNYELKNG